MLPVTHKQQTGLGDMKYFSHVQCLNH